MVRVDGAGASHELIDHLLKLASPRRKVLFTCGWMITAADEAAIALLPASAWQAGLDQDGNLEEDKHVAEITHLMSRAGKWPAGLRWIVRRTKPSRRHAGNLTTYEKATGWRYSIICTNIPGTGIPGVAGSHHPQYIDVVHRQHAVVEDGVRNSKAMGLRNLPSGSFPRTRPGSPAPPSPITCCAPPGPWPASPAPRPEAPRCAATSSTSPPAPPATATATSPCTCPKAGTANRNG